MVKLFRLPNNDKKKIITLGRQLLPNPLFAERQYTVRIFSDGRFW